MRTFVPANMKRIPADATRVFQGAIFDVYQWKQQLFDGSTATFEMLKRPDSVHVIAIKDDKIIMLEQGQPGTGLFYSFPGGRHDAENESELQAAQRELLEETGMTFSNWKLISAVQPYSKIEAVVYTFLATGFVGQKEQKLDAGEKITVTFKTIDEVRGLHRDSKVRDLAKHVFENMDSIQELIELPEITSA